MCEQGFNDARFISHAERSPFFKESKMAEKSHYHCSFWEATPFHFMKYVHYKFFLYEVILTTHFFVFSDQGERPHPASHERLHDLL